MRRVLVPLDGTELATSILPDAIRLAGARGEIILMHDVMAMAFPPRDGFHEERVAALRTSDEYLSRIAGDLHPWNVAVETHTIALGHAAHAIDEAARMYRADMIAATTHGRNQLQRLWWGSTAWRALSHSPVPVLLRHAVEGEQTPPRPIARHILVPLDGSNLAEEALPLAQQLATEWDASISLIRIVSEPVLSVPTGSAYYADDDSLESARTYLQRIARDVPRVTQAGVTTELVVDGIIRAVGRWSITDIVMASHGRTGLARVILGSVADALIQRLHLPIVVVPSLAVASGGAVTKAEEAIAVGSRPRVPDKP